MDCINKLEIELDIAVHFAIAVVIAGKYTKAVYLLRDDGGECLMFP